MTRINRTKHEEIIQYMEELRELTENMDECRHIEKEIVALPEIYDRYLFYMQSLRVQSQTYDSLYNDIRKTTYKELRKARYAAKKK